MSNYYDDKLESRTTDMKGCAVVFGIVIVVIIVALVL